MTALLELVLVRTDDPRVAERLEALAARDPVAARTALHLMDDQAGDALLLSTAYVLAADGSTGRFEWGDRAAHLSVGGAPDFAGGIVTADAAYDEQVDGTVTALSCAGEVPLNGVLVAVECEPGLVLLVSSWPADGLGTRRAVAEANAAAHARLAGLTQAATRRQALEGLLAEE